MSTKIITNKTLKEYEKKYRHNVTLIKVKKTEVESFDAKHKSLEKNILLKNRNWWLIDGTYYEVPKPIGANWIKNLNKGIQIGTCALLVLAAGGASGYVIYRNNYNNSIVVDSSSSKNIEIVSTKTNDQGDKIIDVKGKQGTTLIESIEVYKGDDKLVLDEEYIYTTANTEEQEFIITVYKKALDKHFGPLKIISNNQKQIVVKPGSVQCNLGKIIKFETYLDDGTKIDDCRYTQKGDKCLEAQEEDDTFKAVTIGHCELIVAKKGYAKAIVPVTVTTDKVIVIEPDNPLPDRIKIGEDFEFTASIEGMPEAKFEFYTGGGTISLTPSGNNKVTAHTLKGGLAVIYVTCEPYYKFYSFIVDPIEVSGQRHIDNNTTEAIQFSASNAGEACEGVTWSLEYIDSTEATIDQTGKLTLDPTGIKRPISFFVVAKKESEVRRFNVMIASFNQLKFEINRRDGYCLVESAIDEGTKAKTATGDIYIPTSYYDEYLNGYLPVAGFVSDLEQKTGAFTNCTGITSITLTNNITSLGSYTFKGCTGLKKLSIPTSVREIGKGVIDGCQASLTDGVVFDNTAIPWIIDLEDGTYKGYTPTSSATDNRDKLDVYKEFYWFRSNISISGDDTVKVNETIKLETSEENVVWSVDDKTLATIDEEGNLTAGATAGQVYVFAKSGSKIGAKLITISNE